MKLVLLLFVTLTFAKNPMVITHVEKRNKRITISTSPQGPLYTVTTKKGKVLIKDLGEKDLQAKNPKLYQFVKEALAGSENEILDATVAPEHLEPKKKF